VDKVTEAVLDAMEKWPGSRRALAREIGLTHATLNDISAGRIRATPGTAKRILSALEDRASVLSESADRIRRALITIEEE
jgi:plasmid maintenance system antidote protein VapI